MAASHEEEAHVRDIVKGHQGHRARSKQPHTNGRLCRDSTYRKRPERANPQRQTVGGWLPGLGEGGGGVAAQRVWGFFWGEEKVREPDSSHCCPTRSAKGHGTGQF